MRSKTMTLILMTGLMTATNFMAGCASTNVNKQYPVIPMPPRPSISPDLTKEDFKNMAKYAEQLEVGIKEYNIYAKKQNLKVDEDLSK